MARRSPRVVWLPPTTQNTVGQPTPGNETSWKRFIVEITGTAGNTSVGEVPVVIDGTDDPTNAFASIADLYASSYRLRRIVGKIFIAARPSLVVDPQNLPPRVLGVTAGFIIRRSEGTTGTSFAGLSGNGSLFNPALIGNSPDPWIWRRSWIIQTVGVTAVLTSDAFSIIPFTNFANNGASALDSGHIDQKTARVVGPEERLFLDVSVTVLSNDAAGVGDAVTFVDVCYEARVLASLKSGSGNRRNASR